MKKKDGVVVRQETAKEVIPKIKLQENTWGVEHLPYPDGVAYIQARWDLCIGCGACEIICSLSHHGVINRELSRIRIYRYLTPIPKSVQNVCSQCREEERECQKACPMDPPAIYFDNTEFHMKVDVDRCIGFQCAKCKKACPAEVPTFYPPEYDFALICDLCCGEDGERRPQCVEMCPTYCLEFLQPGFPQHLDRIHPNEKAESSSKKLYPLSKDKIQRAPEEIWGDSK